MDFRSISSKFKIFGSKNLSGHISGNNCRTKIIFSTYKTLRQLPFQWHSKKLCSSSNNWVIAIWKCSKLSVYFVQCGVINAMLRIQQPHKLFHNKKGFNVHFHRDNHIQVVIVSGHICSAERQEYNKSSKMYVFSWSKHSCKQSPLEYLKFRNWYFLKFGKGSTFFSLRLENFSFQSFSHSNQLLLWQK